MEFIVKIIGMFAVFILLFLRTCIPCCPDSSSYFFSPGINEFYGEYKADEQTVKYLKDNRYDVKLSSIELFSGGVVKLHEFPIDVFKRGEKPLYSGNGQWKLGSGENLRIHFNGMIFTNSWQIAHRGGKPVIVISFDDPDCCRFLYYMKE